jgi:Aminoglycoside-2''-adenylyltransferase
MRSMTAKRTFQMLENQTLWETAARVHDLLADQDIPHAIAGGVAVCLHGYRRNTVDLDMLVRPGDTSAVRAALESDGIAWNETDREFCTSSGVAVQFLMAGESEGPGQPAVFPDPADARFVAQIEGLPVLSLAALVQAKLASGLGNLRRTHKDFADVVELIAIHRLNKSFARFLHKSVRPEFRELVRHAKG